jgi:hypothetical protein
MFALRLLGRGPDLQSERGDNFAFDPLPNVRRSLADLLRIQCNSSHHASPLMVVIGCHWSSLPSGYVDPDQAAESPMAVAGTGAFAQSG